MLRLSPNLTECVFCWVETLKDVDSAAGETFVLPKLLWLMFGGPGIFIGLGTAILEHLLLPDLQALYIPSKYTYR